jgi:hypothetical protein
LTAPDQRVNLYKDHNIGNGSGPRSPTVSRAGREGRPASASRPA